MSLIQRIYTEAHGLYLKGLTSGTGTAPLTMRGLENLVGLLRIAVQDEDERQLAEVRGLGT